MASLCWCGRRCCRLHLAEGAGGSYRCCGAVQDVTYEVVLFFTKARTRAWSDVIVTVDGHEVFIESREEFSPGPGNIPEYHSKRFEARAGACCHLLSASMPLRNAPRLDQEPHTRMLM